jgi:FMN phosphatase YigB (HAD superfamily)
MNMDLDYKQLAAIGGYMNTFFFDLDGTLLPMDLDAFMEAYLQTLSRRMIPHGFEPKSFLQLLWTGIKAMVENDGTMTNEQRFWNTFTGPDGEDLRRLKPVFEDYYQKEFIAAKEATVYRPEAGDCIRLLREKGYRVVLATNPLFPRIATLNRMKWAGIREEDFLWITTYENSSFSKTNVEYYREILKVIGKDSSECIMVGNDVQEDMCAAKLGMETFLLTECLINKEGADISCFRQGGFEELLHYIRILPNLEK